MENLVFLMAGLSGWYRYPGRRKQVCLDAGTAPPMGPRFPGPLPAPSSSMCSAHQYHHYQASWWLSSKEPSCQCRRRRFIPWVGKIPKRRKRLPSQIFLPGKPHGQRSLADYSPWGCKDSDTSLNNSNHHCIRCVVLGTGSKALSRKRGSFEQCPFRTRSKELCRLIW